MTTAFVLSGGGSLGAVQVGMLQALTARGVEPDLLIGTSAGALNAAYVAGHGASVTVAGRSRRRSGEAAPPRRVPAAAGPARRRRPSGGHRRCAPTGPFAASSVNTSPSTGSRTPPIPLHVVATDVASGQDVLLSDGDAVDAVLASAAIPAVFPSVRIAGRDLIDGGVADNAAVSQAVTLGADVVYVLPTGYACALEKPPAAPLSSALQALTLLIEQRLILEVAHFADLVDIRVLPPLCPLSVSSTDFRHGALLDRSGPLRQPAAGSTKEALSSPTPSGSSRCTETTSRWTQTRCRPRRPSSHQRWRTCHDN